MSKEREISMLTVEQRQLNLQFQKLEGEYIKEVEKVKALSQDYEEECQKRSNLQSELTNQLSENNKLKTKEKQLIQDLCNLQESKRSIEEELNKMKMIKSMDDLQMKELEDQLEAETYFSLPVQIPNLFARSIAEETIADLEKERTMHELELKDLISRHRTELSNKDVTISNLKDKENEFKKTIEHLTQEKRRVQCKVLSLQEELMNLRNQSANVDDQIQQLNKQIQQERLLKLQAVNKLAEIMNRKDNLDWKAGLSIPSKQNIKRHGWKKLYVVVSSRKIIFYNNEADKLNADPIIILNLNKLFHVSPVTQGDAIRAEVKDIPRIFQLPLCW
ncbi:rho-associated protein kinase 1 [Caerostris extrusa]|uniref:non-specific serine/threonine protein kinase n=1 Tax=Caerostris extrusa TaxID=172846 RepID=A0AAV4USI0_CAEEX|nr:rho-associated protein kinase 1 [Caerostris extrusa]